MEKVLLLQIFLWCMSLVYCGKVCFLQFPPSLGFNKVYSARISKLDSILASLLGYSTKTSKWKGSSVLDPFNYPSSAVVFHIPVSTKSVDFKGPTYDLVEDALLTDSLKSLHEWIGARAQRPLAFRYFEPESLGGITPEELPKLVNLDISVPEDGGFLREVSVLPNLVENFSNFSRKKAGGQDVFTITLGKYASLVEHYGVDSLKAKEASSILKHIIAKCIIKLRSIYDDKVLVTAVFFSEKEALENNIITREKREINMQGSAMALKIADAYRDDFPVVFNIVLILGILFVAAIIAVSLSMAYMDPGRDSIIYRMTNPRMKKD